MTVAGRLRDACVRAMIIVAAGCDASAESAGEARDAAAGRDGEVSDRDAMVARDADVRDAYARDAYARDADIRDADIRDADVRDADVRDADLACNACLPLELTWTSSEHANPGGRAPSFTLSGCGELMFTSTDREVCSVALPCTAEPGALSMTALMQALEHPDAVEALEGPAHSRYGLETDDAAATYQVFYGDKTYFIYDSCDASQDAGCVDDGLAALVKLLDRFDSESCAGPWTHDCSSPARRGFCDAAFRGYRHNPETGECEPGSFAGCGGNANFYLSLEECEAACVSP